MVLVAERPDSLVLALERSLPGCVMPWWVTSWQVMSCEQVAYGGSACESQDHLERQDARQPSRGKARFALV